ncbi:MAG: hypothetical protein V2A77_05070 [Pseudomonadota bacterium]
MPTKSPGKISLERAKNIADTIVARLKPYCARIEIAGSIRRRRPLVNDIDIVLVPSDPWNMKHELMAVGQLTMGGSKIMRLVVPSQVGPLQVDIYIAMPETWATLLLIRTGSAANNIRLCTRAKEKGWHLAASGDGLFDEKGVRIAGDTEVSIYNALGEKWQEPTERG